MFDARGGIVRRRRWRWRTLRAASARPNRAADDRADRAGRGTRACDTSVPPLIPGPGYRTGTGRWGWKRDVDRAQITECCCDRKKNCPTLCETSLSLPPQATTSDLSVMELASIPLTLNLSRCTSLSANGASAICTSEGASGAAGVSPWTKLHRLDRSIFRFVL